MNSHNLTPNTKNLLLFRESCKYIPGGVNSPVRAFKSVGGIPLFIQKAKGSKIYDIEGKEYIDYCMSWGAIILGHAYEKVVDKVKDVVKNGTSFGTPTLLEVKFAKKICATFASIEMVRLVNSGTEACMSAIRLARGYTGRKKIIKFAGCYHGHADYLLVQAGSGLTTFRSMFNVQCSMFNEKRTTNYEPRTTSSGIPEDFIKHTFVLPYNDIIAVEKVVKKYHKDIACIIVEPICGNMGVVLPKNNFLVKLREICDYYEIVLIFDEIITGFRICYGGAQNLFNIKPDLTCLGKIIGAGFPIAAFGGKKKIMELLSPLGNVYQAGTLSGNPVCAIAGIATLEILQLMNYDSLGRKTKILCEEIKKNAKKLGINIVINQIGSMFTVFFTNEKEVFNYNTSINSNTKRYAKFFHKMLELGVYLPPSQFESCFLSFSHSDRDIEKTIESSIVALKFIK